VQSDDDQPRWPGTEPAAEGAPTRRKGSIRRTTVVDMLRPEGLSGPLVLAGTGRDMATGIDGEAYLVAAAASSVGIDFVGGRIVTAIRTDPEARGLDELVGQRAGSGFRRALAAAGPEHVRSGSLVHLLLDETPAATLISGSVLAREGVMAFDTPERRAHLPVDICAGWKEGGAIVTSVRDHGTPILGPGPAAPSLGRDDDPLAWHPAVPLPHTGMRRRRMLDLWRGVGPDGRSATAPIRADLLLRDSYADADGTERVVHEYRVNARLDHQTWAVTDISVVPGPLPAPECPSAAASAQHVVGIEAEDLREVVRDELTGTTTCTHLNDVLRALADAPTLWAAGSLARGEAVA
jgi:hypothetical protein